MLDWFNLGQECADEAYSSKRDLEGDRVHVTSKVGTVTFEGVDIIRVMK